MNQKWEVACCLVGNFNKVRFPSERLDCDIFSFAMLEFSRFITK